MSDELKSLVISGILKFPKFTKPMSFDNNTNKFVIDEVDGEYGCIIELDSKSATEQMKKITEFIDLEKEKLAKLEKYDKSYAINVNYPFTDTLDKDKKPTGSYDFKFKRKAINKKGDKAFIAFVDAKKQHITPDELELITNGSKVNVKCCLYSWDKLTLDTRTKEKWVDFGVSLCLLAVQVVEAVKKGGDIDCFDVVDGYDSQYEDDLIGEDEIPF